jgi:uncharacterized metal-binding protein YceD (DUF177 family)
MSMSEFSRLVPLARIGAEPFRQQITASESEREALARRFDLVSLDRLSADIELIRQRGDMLLLRASYEATFVQECAVTLDPIEGVMADSFALRYGPPEAEPSDPDPEGEAFEPLTGDAVDVGEAVAQEFSLALPAFPRSPDAAIELDAPAPGTGPFAALDRLIRGPSE